jgi:photosystem II protein
MFYFEQPAILGDDVTAEITGMYMIDEEGEIVTREVNAKFINGKPTAIEVTYVMKSPAEWDRFMRFMNRYAEENGLGFSKS